MTAVIGVVGGVLGWILAGIIAVGALSAALGGTPNPLVAAIQGAAPRLIVAGFLVGAFLVVVAKDLAYTALPGGVLLAGAFAWTLQLLPVAEVTGTPAKDGLHLLSVNLLITNADVEAIAEDLGAFDADVLVTLETESATRDALERHLPSYRIVSTGSGERGRWASVWVHERVAGNVVVERQLRIAGEHLPGVEYRSGDAREIIHIVGVHLHSPAGGDDASAWRRELDALAEHAAGNGANLVLAGDFNAGGAHPAFAALLGNMRDAGRTPWGTGTPTWPVFGRGHGTYRWFLPTLDLDHILTGGTLATKGYRTARIHGSDHLGVSAEILLRDRVDTRSTAVVRHQRSS